MVPLTKLYIFLFLFCIFTLTSGSSHSTVTFTFFLSPYTYFEYLKEKKEVDKIIKSSLKKSLQISSISEFKVTHSTSDSTIYPVRKLSASSLIRISFSHKVLSTKAETLSILFNSIINSNTLFDYSSEQISSTQLSTTSTLTPSYNIVPHKSSDKEITESRVSGAIWGSLISAIFLYACYSVFHKYYKSEREII